MRSKISGTTLPVLEIGLEQGDNIVSEPGRFSWMSPNVRLQTSARTAGAKGFFGVIGRALSGGGLFMNEYASTGGQAMVAFASKVPGAIMEVRVRPGQSFLIHRHGFLCGTAGVELSIGFQRSLGAGIFGGDGLFIARLTGPGKIWLQTLTMPNLAHALLPYMGREAATSGTAIGAETGGAAGGAVLGSLFGGSE